MMTVQTARLTPTASASFFVGSTIRISNNDNAWVSRHGRSYALIVATVAVRHLWEHSGALALGF